MQNLPTSISAQFDDAVRAYPGAVVCILDPEGQLLNISPSVVAIHGYSQAEMIGQNFAKYFNADDVTHLKLVIQDCLLTGESIDASRRVRHKSGEYRRVHGRGKKLELELEDDTTNKEYILSIGWPYE
jgi:PAS domain S-box-containing protein